MNLSQYMSDIFGRTIECECGKIHKIDPREVVFSIEAKERLPAILEKYATLRRALILADKRTWHAAGEAAFRILTNNYWSVEKIIVPDPAPVKSPVCDDITFDALRTKAPPADIILPVGSGVINDLGKWLAADLKLPCVSFATAASMNGYTSANVAVTARGVKTLERARPPRAVMADPSILRDAPFEMTAAGLGDLLAKSVSSADWFMNHSLFGDYYCKRSVSLLEEIEPLYMNRPEDVRDRKPEALEALFHGLLLTGAAMTMAETSSPASGGEHLVSHTLDMMSFIDGKPHDLHGRQVGVGTILAADLYRRVLSLESPSLTLPEPEIDRDFWGPLSKEVEKQYSEKSERVEKARQILSRGNAWDNLRERLSTMVRDPEKIRDCLMRAGAATGAGDIGCDSGRLLAAFLHAHEMRSRFTILDLASMAGILPKAAGEIVEEWG